MLINSFALFVNYFGLSPKFKSESDNYYFCLFTNSIKSDSFYSYQSNIEKYTEYKWEENFYPFVKFYSSWYDGFYFNGLFPYFDYTEFLVYSLLIFGYFILKKMINNKSIEESLVEENSEIPKKVFKFKKTKEYKQLENLYNLGVLNDDEFNNKAKTLKKKFKDNLL